MTDEEHQLLVALAWMCEQYLTDRPEGTLDHMCMSAGEGALELLYKYDLVDSIGRHARWTDAGHALLDAS